MHRNVVSKADRSYLDMNLRITIFSSTVLIAFILMGCSGDVNPVAPDQGAWVSDIPFTYTLLGIENTLPHDNRIYETANFLIFSDASSDALKIEIAVIAEESLAELKQAFTISSSTELGITDQESKVKIYINRYLAHHQEVFACGMIIYSPESPPSVPVQRYSRLIKHELMHVFQHLLGLGLNGYDDWPDCWFSEGIAEFISGGVHDTITSQDEIDGWIAAEDHVCPVSIHSFHDYPVRFDRVNEYYPIFELAVRYLLDPDGRNKKISDVKQLYEALKNGDAFSTAFVNTMGMSLDYYENHFFELISEFL